MKRCCQETQYGEIQQEIRSASPVRFIRLRSLILKMNSKVVLVLLVLASTFMFESRALQAGMGEMERSGIKGRKRQFIASDEVRIINHKVKTVYDWPCKSRKSCHCCCIVSGKNCDSCQDLEVFYLQNPLSSKTCANIIDASVIKSFLLNSRLIG